MANTTVSTLVSVLRQSRLLDPDQQAELERELHSRFTDARSLAKELIQRGWLTTYQIQQLSKTRGQGLVLGQYLLLDLLGEGGMGQVYRARHRSLGRIVALKVIRKDRLTNPDAVRRFHREIQAVGQLSHPNVVMAYAADEIDGTHFFSMEYVEGVDLGKLVKTHGPLPIPLAANYIWQAAQGLQHAFERGLVHRDIKPANLLVSKKDGVVKILDMGLARLGDSGDDSNLETLTQDGKVMGTPDYIAPEQARNSRTADIRSDLYSLGCTFYYILTGAVPFPGGGSVMEKLMRHQMESWVPVEKLRPEVPEGIRAILRKLIVRDPAGRFQTPAQLAAALEPFALQAATQTTPPLVTLPATDASVLPDVLPAVPGGSSATRGHANGAPGSGRIRVSTSETVAGSGSSTDPFGRKAGLFRRWGGRAVAVIGVGLVLLGVLAYSVPRETAPSAKDAQTSSDKPSSDKNSDGKDVTKPPRLKGPHYSSAWDDLKGGQPGLPKEVVAISSHPLGRLWTTHGVGRLVPSPDGAFVAASPFNSNSSVVVWDAHTMQPKLTVQGSLSNSLIHDFHFAPDGSKFFVVFIQFSTNALEMQAFHIDKKSGKFAPVPAREFQTTNLQSPTLSPDGSLLAGTDKEPVRQLVIWNTKTAKRVVELPITGARFISPVFSLDGNRLAYIHSDTSKGKANLVVLDPHKGVETSRIEEPATRLHRLQFTRDGKRLLYLADGLLRIRDLEKDESLAIPDTARAPAEQILMDRDGQRVILVRTRTSGRKTQFLGVAGNEVKVLKTLDQLELPQFIHIALPNDDLAIYFLSLDFRLHRCDLKTGVVSTLAFKKNSGQLSTFALADDGTALFTGGRDGDVRGWKLPSLEPVVDQPASPNLLTLRFAPDRPTLLYSRNDPTSDDSRGALYEWDPSGTSRRVPLESVDGRFEDTAISNDGRLFAATYSTAGNPTRNVGFWSLPNGKRLGSVTLGETPTNGINFDPKGKRLAVLQSKAKGSPLETILRMIDSSSFTEVDSCLLPISSQGKGSLAFDQDGRFAAIGQLMIGKFAIIDLASKSIHEHPLNSIREFREYLTAFAVSENGKVIAAATTTAVGKSASTIHVAEFEGKSLRILPIVESAPVVVLALSADGKLLAVAHADGTIALWNVSSQKTLTSFRLPGPATHLAFSPDRRYLASGNSNGSIWLFRLTDLALG